jgi:hypothetical protein
VSAYALWRAARHRLAVLGAATVLVLGGGFLTLALTGGTAGADTSLGGFTVNALAEAASATYEQPNFPFPTDPTLEVDEGYSTVTNNYPSTETATASVFYPGEIIANAGPQLSLLVPGVPLPPAPVWPLEAVTNFPQTPNTASTDEPGVNMDASSTTDGTSASASLGDDTPGAGAAAGGSGASTTSGTGNPLASSSSLIGIGGISSTSSSDAPGTTASGTATATVSGISVLEGFISIGSVTSTATATSDGTTGTVSGSTVLANASIAGMPVTINADGIEASGKSTPLAVPISTVNSLLKELGITIAVTNPVDTINGASASRTLDGLLITVNLTTLDNAANKLTSLLPAKLTSELPVPLPDQQVIGLYLGTVTVSSAASPAFDDDDSGSGTAGDTSGLTSPSSGFTSPTSSGSFDSGTDFASGTTSPTVGTTGTPSGTGGSPSSGLTNGEPTSAVTPVFHGIGTGLVLLGLLMAAVLAYAYKRVDDTSELVGPACTDGDPLADRFLDGGDPTANAGDFGA